jgi:hypothetical protein
MSDLYSFNEWCSQIVIRDYLDSKGFDGIHYSEEDGASQYQIWNNGGRQIVESNDNSELDVDQVYKEIERDFIDEWHKLYNATTDEVLGLIYCEPINTFDVDSAMFILPDGRIVSAEKTLKDNNLDEYATHESICWLMAFHTIAKICEKYNDDDINAFDFMDENDSLIDKCIKQMLDNLTYIKDWARINCGTSYVEERFYCVLPNYMKSAQYNVLEDWLLWGE